MRRTVRCVDVDFSSSREETFSGGDGGGVLTAPDLSLDVRGFASLRESVGAYFRTERLEGPNAYAAEGWGLVAARLRAEVAAAPRALQLHLKRFDFDPVRRKNVKVMQGGGCLTKRLMTGSNLGWSWI
jgi:ubiquitin carboxyl-terminal hydrolase 7